MPFESLFPFGIVVSQYFFGIVLFIISVFLILLVLVQRGRGGGLTGALGGPGGQSAFGTKAGDVFTKITIVTAAIWIFMCALGVYWMQQPPLPLTNSTSSDIGISSGASGSGASGNGATGSGTNGIGDLGSPSLGSDPVVPTGSLPPSGTESGSPTPTNPADAPQVPAGDAPQVPSNDALQSGSDSAGDPPNEGNPKSDDSPKTEGGSESPS